MWPATVEEFREWLELARDLGGTAVRGRLADFPILRPHLDALADRATRMMERTALRRWRERSRLPNYVAGRLPFIHWFSELAYRAGLRGVLLLDDVAACLAGLTVEQQRLLLWFYVDQLTFAQAAAVLRHDPQNVARRGRPIEIREVRDFSRQAYRALRNQIVLRLGEDNDGFVLFPAAVGYGF